MANVQNNVNNSNSHNLGNQVQIYAPQAVKENKPISFLNYLLLKEIASRSKIDDSENVPP